MNQVTRHGRQIDGSAQLFVVGNLMLALLVGGGVAYSLFSNGRLPEIHVGYAHAYQRLIHSGQQSTVIPALRTAAAINFDDGFAQLQLLSAAYEAHDTESIILGLRGLLNHAPDDSELHGELAIVLLDTGYFDDAAVHSGLAVKLNPDSAHLQVIEGAVLLALGRNHEAAASYRKALALNPDSEPAQRALKFPLKDY